jgi:hypothetical protein
LATSYAEAAKRVGDWARTEKLKGSEAQRFRGVLRLIEQDAGLIATKRKPIGEALKERFSRPMYSSICFGGGHDVPGGQARLRQPIAYARCAPSTGALFDV